MNLAAILCLYFALKVAVVGAYAVKIRPTASSWPMAIALGWAALHLCLIGLLLALSFFNAMSGMAVWMFLGFALLLASRQSRTIQVDSAGPGKSILPMLTGLAVLTMFVFLFHRSLYFFDTTWDALTYELPRVSLYVESKSLFVHHSTAALNIFSNEWNGELVGLLATLACGSDQAIGFGGVETWLWGWIALFAAAQRLGAAAVYAALIALLLMTTPAVLGLAMVIKGDLLAAVALCLGIACLVPRNTGKEGFWLASGAVVLSFAAGAKITVLPLVFLLVVYAGVHLARNRQTRRWLPLIALLCALGTARYIANIFVYHDPVKRVEAEQTFPGFITLRENLVGLAGKCLDTVSWPWAADSERLALGFGFGAAGWLSIFSILFFILGRKTLDQKWLKPGSLLVLVFVLSWLYVAWNIPWRPWAFRYHLPWVMVVALLALVAGASRFTIRHVSMAGPALLLAAIIQGVYACGQGEVRPSSFHEARFRSQLERKVAFNSYMASPALQDFARAPSMDVTIFNQLNSAILPFFGDDSRHRVRLVVSADALIASAQGQADAVVLAGPKPEDYNLISARLQRLGFSESVDNIFFRLWRKPVPIEHAREAPAHP